MNERVGIRRLMPLLIAVSLFAGCAIAPDKGQLPAVYDFGLPEAQSGDKREWSGMALEVVSPPWFEALSVDYRLAYDDPLKRREYSGSRWAGAPGVLLAQRLRQRLGMASANGNAAAHCLLRVELQEFSQVFDLPTQSRGVIVASVSLIDGRKRLIVGKHFSIEQPAVTPDARGGVDALVVAGSDFATQLAIWLETLEKRNALERCQSADASAAPRK